MGGSFLLAWEVCAQSVTEPWQAHSDTLEMSDGHALASASGPGAGFTSVIHLTDLDRMNGNLADILRHAAGVSVRRTGGLGDWMGISIWGGPENQVGILIDGIPLARNENTAQVLSTLDLAKVERIEINRGRGGDLTMGSAPGGTIHVITRQDLGGSQGQVALGAGSHGALRAQAGISTRVGTSSAMVQGVIDSAQNNFSFVDDEGAEYRPGRWPLAAPLKDEDDLRTARRNHNGHRYVEGMLRLNQKRPEGLRSLALSMSRLDKEIPPITTGYDAEHPPAAKRSSNSAHVLGQWEGGPWNQLWRYSLRTVTENYVDTGFGGGQVGIGWNDESHHYAEWQTSVMGTIPWTRPSASPTLSDMARRIQLAYALGLSMDGHRGYEHVRNRSTPWHRRIVAEAKLRPEWQNQKSYAGLTLEWLRPFSSQAESFWGESLSENAVEYEPNQNAPQEKSLWDLRFEGRHQWSAHWKTQWQIGNGHRLPTFLETFGDRGGVVGNPNLKPEHTFTSALAVLGNWSAWNWESRIYDIEAWDLLLLERNSQFVMRYRNADRTRTYGWENSLLWRPWEILRLSAALTAQKAYRLKAGPAYDDGKLLPHRPLLQGAFGQTLRLGNWSAETEAFLRGGSEGNSLNAGNLWDGWSHHSEYQVEVDARLNYARRGFLISAQIENLTDAQNFDVFGWPHPGRSYRISAQWSH